MQFAHGILATENRRNREILDSIRSRKVTNMRELGTITGVTRFAQ